MRTILMLIIMLGACGLIAQSALRPSWSETQDFLQVLSIRNPELGIHAASRPVTLRSLHDQLLPYYRENSLSQAEQERLLKLLYRERSYLNRTSNNVAGYNYVDSSKVFYEYNAEERESDLLLDYDKPLLGVFWKNPAHFYEYHSDHFTLDLNPLIHVAGFKGNEDGLFFENQRGLIARAMIDRKVYINAAIYDNQARFADYIQREITETNAVPQAGFFKRFNSGLVDTPDSYDYLLARGNLGVLISPHVLVELGHDRHRIGDGLRSLLLSDYSPEYFYLKFQIEVWKIKYQTIIAELTEQFEPGGPDDRLRRKYMATHYLNIQLNKKWQLGLFESVIFNRSDQFELQYLNPVIFYRAVEGAIGSPDNVILGLNTSYTINNRLKIYGQAVADEFKISEIREGRGWWANKFGFQLGIHYLDVLGIKNLHWQSEINTVRPYTYTHRDISSNYTHYNQPLAHPLGANFREWINRLRYNTSGKWSAEGWLSFSQTGDDPDGENLGGDIFIANREVSSIRPFGNSTAQGIRSNTWTLAATLSYQFWQNAYIDVHGMWRDQSSQSAAISNTTSYVGLGVRLNFTRQPLIL